MNEQEKNWSEKKESRRKSLSLYYKGCLYMNGSMYSKCYPFVLYTTL